MTATIAATTPPYLVAGAGGTTLAIAGTGFTGASVARVGGLGLDARRTSRPTTYVGPTALTMVLIAPDVARPGFLLLAVDDGAPHYLRVYHPVTDPPPPPAWVPPPPVVRLTTEAGGRLTTEAGDPLATET